MMRLLFSAPLSPLAHTLHRTASARTWFALGEPHLGRVSVFADTDASDWRHVALQATHELAKAALHHFSGITRDTLDAADTALLDAYAHTRRPRLTDHASVTASALEISLALSLGVNLAAYGAATRGVLHDADYARLSLRPSPEEEAAFRAVFSSVQASYGHI